jgi:glycosyltransferase involved in cell wall biosynthesis
MQSGSENLPRVSFIMPTLNVEALLDNALSSITRQTYPRDRYEILLADAHSTDRTREIAKKYGAIVIDDDGKNMEEGKRLALQHATGEYIVFVDADNEITHPDYIELAVKALAANPQALGVESYYLPSPKMSSFCAYLTHRLHISDPIAWLMSTNPQTRGARGRGGTLDSARRFAFVSARRQRICFSPRRFGVGEGRMNIFRTRTRRCTSCAKASANGCGFAVAACIIIYVQTLWGFVQKRRRATVHFLRVQQEAKTNWMKEKPPVPLWLAGVYCVTFAGPIWHTVRGLIRDGDPRWLWHVPASLGSVLGDAWGVWTYKRRGGAQPRWLVGS